MRTPYGDDLIDQEWNIIEPILASIEQIQGVSSRLLTAKNTEYCILFVKNRLLLETSTR